MQNDSFEQLIGRIGRPESLRHKSYSVPQQDTFARMHQNESALPLDQEGLSELWHELAGALERSWQNAGRGLQVYPSLDPNVLRSAYARYLGIGTEHLEVFAGSSDALQTIAAGCFRPGSRIAFFEPSFSILRDMVLFWQAEYVPIRLKADFSVSAASLLSEAVLSADVTILCTPNNPTGATIQPELVHDFVRKSRGLVVIDEAYFECAHARDAAHPHFLQLALSQPNVVLTRTLSKAWGAAGLRLGALVGSPEAVRFFGGLRHPYSVSAPTEILATYILEHKQHLMETICRQATATCAAMELELQTLAAALEAKGDNNTKGSLKVYPSMANFVFFRSTHAAEIERRCLQAGIIIRSFSLARQTDEGHLEEGSFVRASPWDTSSTATFLRIVKEVHLAQDLSS